MLNVNYPQRGGRGEGEIPPCAVSTESCAIEEEHLPAMFKGCWLHQPPWPRYSGDTAALTRAQPDRFKAFDTVIGLHIRSRAFL